MFWKSRILPTAGALGLVALIGASWAGADRQEIIKVGVGGDGEADIVTIENLPVGASRQMWTESGKEVIVYRAEDHLEIDVGGENIVVNLPKHDDGAAHEGDHHNVRIEKHVEVSGDGEKHVIVKHLGDHEDGRVLEDLDLESIERLVEEADGESVVRVDVNDDGVEEKVVIVKRTQEKD